MTDETHKPSSDLSVRTAREAPLARVGPRESESAPRAQRGQHLPRVPAGELDPAGIEFAALRDPVDEDEAVTRDRSQLPFRTEPPETKTPESPGTRAARRAAGSLRERGAELLGPEERTVTGGTLLSIGSVDPRAKTERDLETPRTFMTQAQTEAHAYFKPSLLPAVTVRPRLEVETVKLSDSVDPRKAKTIPRLERAIVEPEPVRGSPADGEPSAALAPLELAEPLVEDGAWRSPASLEAEAMHGYAAFERAEASDVPYGVRADGQIHASVSAFRGEPVSDYSLHGVPTQQEPVFARRAERASAPPDAVLTQRDLPALRRPSIPSPLAEALPASQPARSEAEPLRASPPAPISASLADLFEPPAASHASGPAQLPVSERTSPSAAQWALSTPRPTPARPRADLAAFSDARPSEAPSTMTASISADYEQPLRGRRGWFVLVIVAVLVAISLSYLAVRGEGAEAPAGEPEGDESSAPTPLAPSPAATAEAPSEPEVREPGLNTVGEAPADSAGAVKQALPSGTVLAPASAPAGSARKSVPSKSREPIF